MARIALLVLVLLAFPAAASAGGFATVQLSSLPEGTPPGGTWSVELTVLAHGRTPLDGLAPLVRIHGDGASREFPAAPTGRPGVYAADVVFPSEGTWRWEIWDGYTQTHTYAPVAITGGPAGPDSFPVVPVAAGAAGALALALGALALVARRRGAGPRVAAGAS